MGPNTDEIKSKASLFLSEEKQKQDIRGISILADTERPVSIGVLELALLGLKVRLTTCQYSKKNLREIVASLTALNGLLQLQKSPLTGTVTSLIYDAEWTARIGYEYPIKQRKKATR